MNLRAGVQIGLVEHEWPHDMDPEERTPGNAKLVLRSYTSLGPEWLPPHQHMVVRLRDSRGREFNLTARELAANRTTA